jgi:two-component system response regulator YesN
MYRMLIADDDYITLEGLRDFIDWSAMGISVVGEAEDGRQALDAAKSARPDILLTDVAMPVMNGIELAEQVRRELPDTMIVMISGHQDVHYLKSALKLDAVDYVLKPFHPEELRTVMDKVVRKLEERRRERQREREIEYFGDSLLVAQSTDIREPLERIVSLFGTGQPEALVAEVRSFYRTIRGKKMASVLFLTSISAELLAKTVRHVSEHKAFEGMEELAKSFPLTGLNGDSHRVEELVLQKLLEMEALLQESRAGRAKRIVREAESMIQAKFGQALTIQQIAGDIYVSPSYLQTLFKKETGQTINDYLTHVRMEKAKQLLKEPGVKIYEVAAQVGYLDTNYFSRTFKKIVGVGPQEFR